MINCEESFCEKIQLAICLHCLHRLCIYHIEEHQKILADDINELKNQVNEVNIILTNASNMIVEERKIEENKCNDWRQQKLTEIEREYNRRINSIEDRQKKLEQLELELNQRVKVEIQQPLEDMCIHKSINLDLIKSIQLTIETIKQDSTYLKWNFENSNNINHSKSSDENEKIDLEGKEKIIKTWKPENLMYQLFQRVDHKSVDRIDEFVQNMKDENSMENNGLITLTYSFLETWHQMETRGSKYKQLILDKHILTIKKYVIGKDCQRKVLIALEYFYHQFIYKEKLKIGMMTMLLQLFFNHQCISISEMIDWYSNDQIIGKNLDKKWAEPFMNQHGCHIHSITLPSTETSLINIENNSNIKHVRIHKPVKNLVKLFKHQSTKKSQIIHNFIKMQFGKRIDYRVVMIVRCYLKAWNDCLLEKKNDFLLKSLCIIEYYKSDPDFEMQILFAIEIFLSSQNRKKDNWPIETISTLFQLFFDHNLITKETFLQWNSNGHFYNEIYYEQTKDFAQSFMQQLITS